ncbi:PDR/VanB family oxidoreductase [Corynebacterium comes]|uniref:Phenoxybenzoate dioxygenase subunit beta n=1 Tax=Corynebacterium comes TaxID=2675218 RepID=A0A6B8W1I4_9CORY|nr:PDR/VanB family oxidoreductase [Corynebacterium comes]QGU04796.1 Phenoxybenzoate dioxygenase subunit beta [Corynebacterium comes]
MNASAHEWQDAEVVATAEVADRIRRITLRPSRPPQGRTVQPGEHLKVLVGIDGSEVKRSYSIVDAAPDGSDVSLTVFHTPNSRGGSAYMHSLQVGDTLRVTQPQQNFPLRIGAPRYVLVAGGIGITAIRGMASLLRRLGADYSIHYAARSPEAMAYREELIAEHGDRLTTYFDSESVFLDAHALISTMEAGAELYMCGPIRLMDAIRRAWRELELDPTNLRFETFGNSGWYEARRFRVNLPRLGVSTEIGANETILEALQKIGVAMMYDCRRGECGLCQVKVTDVDGRIDHRDVFFSDRQKNASEKLCACVSRVVPHDPISATSTAQLTIDVP